MNIAAVDFESIDVSSYARLVAEISKLDEACRDAPARLAIDVHHTCTIDQLVPYLKYEIYRLGRVPQITIGSYDSVPAELIATEGLAGGNPNLAVVVVNPELVLCFDANGCVDEAESIVRLDMILQLAAKRPYPVMITNLACSTELAFPQTDRFTSVLARLNEHIDRSIASSTNLHLIDLSMLAFSLGEVQSFDRRNWFRFKAPYKTGLLAALAGEIAATVRDVIGLAKKCIVLDCDNTLWGGVIGEVGIDGIALDPHSYPGNAYYAFQQSVVRLQKSGVMVALLSKNNESDVVEVLERHPHCVIRLDMLVGYRVDWNHKPENLRALAADLNIGLDAMLFLDDSTIECELMRSQIPEVQTVQIPHDKYLLPGLLSKYRVFPTRRATAEDLKRSTLYRQEGERRRAQQHFESHDDFLASLNMEALIGPVLAGQVRRVAQLFSRTNQFMLTDHRPTEPEISALTGDTPQRCYVISARDKFGDLGLIGAMLLHNDGRTIAIESLAVSCRALSRRLEDLFIVEAVRQISQDKDTAVEGLYKPSKKNMQVAELYPRLGFFAKCKLDNGSCVFETSLTDLVAQRPGFIKVLPNE